MKITTDYLDEALSFERFPNVIRRLCAKIKEKCPNAQAVAFRGNSGALVGMSVCASLKLPPLLVRKGASHSNCKVEGARGVTNFVIVDDFISSGKTVKTIIKECKWLLGDGVECLAVFTYDQSVHLAGESKEISVPIYRTFKKGES